MLLSGFVCNNNTPTEQAILSLSSKWNANAEPDNPVPHSHPSGLEFLFRLWSYVYDPKGISDQYLIKTLNHSILIDIKEEEQVRYWRCGLYERPGAYAYVNAKSHITERGDGHLQIKCPGRREFSSDFQYASIENLQVEPFCRSDLAMFSKKRRFAISWIDRFQPVVDITFDRTRAAKLVDIWEKEREISDLIPVRNLIELVAFYLI